VAGVTFSNSDSAPVPKFLNPGPAIIQIWESDSSSDSGCNHRSNRSLPIFCWRNDHTDSCYYRNGKVTPDPGQVFHKFWLRVRRRKKNAESCRSRLRIRYHFWFTEVMVIRDEHGSGLDRTQSGLKPIFAGSGLDRTTIIFKIGGSGLDWTEKIFVF